MTLLERFRRSPDKNGLPEEYRALWLNGNIFHEFTRFVTTPEGRNIDRLAEILTHGLIPPSLDTTGKVVLNWQEVRRFYKTSATYDSVIFLHRYCDGSSMHKPWLTDKKGKTYIFLDSDYPVHTPSDMGPDWPILVMGDFEVYSKQVVAPENFRTLVVSTQAASSVADEFASRLHDLNIELFDFKGTKLI